MGNRFRITLASFFAYFVMSGMLAPIGIIAGPMADHFARPVTEITAMFSWLTLGILVGSISALLVFDWLSLKRVMLLLYTLITLALVSLALFDSLLVVRPALGIVGLCCGIGLPGAASTISSSYTLNARASMLVITDACFSVAGILCSWLAVLLVARQAHWSGAYLLVAAVAAALVLLASVSTFPSAGREQPAGGTAPDGDALRWPSGVWLCICALFLYTLGQYSLLWWLPTHLETRLAIPREQAGEVVGQFWTGMLCAQLFVAWWVLKIGVQRLMLIGAATTCLCSLPLWLYTDISGLLVLAFIWGFANLGLLKIVISFGTLLVSTPSPRLVAGLLLGATLGTAVSPWVTSRVVEVSSARVVLQFGSACYLALFVLLLVASRQFARRSLAAPSADLGR